MEGTVTFLDKAKDLFGFVLEIGTDAVTWAVSTEPVNYFLGLGLIGCAIGIVYKIRH